MKVYAPKRYSGGIEKWLTEIFRVHSREEYAEFFTRGFKEREGVQRVYPWFYSRVFLLCLALFSAFAFTVTVTAEALSYIGLPNVIITGAILLNVPILVFLYEVYPKLDLSFIGLCAITVVCSAVADILINFGYFLFTPDDKWLSVLWTAFVEETGKALPALVAIFVLKKRDPLQCLVIGASVGIGMAVCEDMGYIFFSAIAGFADMGAAVFVTVIRALTAFFGHVIWTGFIGWAFAKFKRPLINIKFWGMYLLSMALHYIWDFPELDFSLLAVLFSLVVGIIVFTGIIKRERFNIYYPKQPPAPAEVVQPEPVAQTVQPEPVAETAATTSDDPFADVAAPAPNSYVSPAVSPYAYNAPALATTAAPVFNHAGIALTVTSIVLCVLAMAFCMFGVNGGVDTYYYDTVEEFRYAVHNGKNLVTDADREYDFTQKNYAVYTVEGKIEKVVQKEELSGCNYYYTYTRGLFGNYELFSLEAEVDGERHELESFYDGSGYVYYYRIAEGIENCYFDEDYNQYAVQTFIGYSFNASADITLGIIAGVVVALGGAIALALGLSQRKQNRGDKLKE